MANLAGDPRWPLPRCPVCGAPRGSAAAAVLGELRSGRAVEGEAMELGAGAVPSGRDAERGWSSDGGNGK